MFSSSSSNSKIHSERNQRALLELANKPGNDVCADCKARAPRWASHNLGIFVCVNCASIHRKIGTHITKVKSITLDTWTKEQVETMKQNGNLKSNALYNPDEQRHPPPANLIDSERDSELEKYIRSKYEFKSFMKPATSSSFGRFPPLNTSVSSDRSAAVAALLGPSRSAASRLSISPTASNTSHKSSLPPPPVPQKVPASASQASLSPTASDSARSPLRSVSQPVSPQAQSQHQQTAPSGGVWNDLQTLQSKTIDATLPLQVASYQPSVQPLTIPNSGTPTYLSTPNPFGNLSVSPANPFPSPLGQQATGISPNMVGRSISLGSGLSTTPMGQSYQNGLSAFQSSPSASFTPLSTTPSPNPFVPQALPALNGMSTGMGAPGMSPSPQPIFGGSSFGGQQPMLSNQASHSQLFQQSVQAPTFYPQPQYQTQLQVPNQMNPYMQSQAPGTPFMTSTPQPYNTTPSPYAAMQSAPLQQQMQQPQHGMGAGNPFTSWVQQPPSQQPWGM